MTLKNQPGLLQLTADVDIVAADAVEGEAPPRPKFSIVGYTGSTMSISGYYSPVVIDLAGMKVSRAQIPALLDHDSSRIVGQTDAVTIDGKGVRLSGILTGDDTDAAKIVMHAKNGFRWQASIGASVQSSEFVKPGSKASVNGREVDGPVFVIRQSTLKEISFVAIGADDQTSAAVAASLSLGLPSGAEIMQFDQWLVAKGFSDPAAITDVQREFLRAMYDAEQADEKTKKPKTTSDLTLESVLSARRKEDDRKQRIAAIVAEACDDRPALIDEFGRMGEAAIAASATPEELELQILRVRASAGPAIHARQGLGTTGPSVIEAAVCRAGGLKDVEKQYDERTLNLSYDRFRDGIGLADLIMLCARENGWRGLSLTTAELRPALSAAFGVPRDGGIRASGFSTLTIPGILSNTANKFLRQGFIAVESGWRSLASVRPVRDFKTISGYSLTGSLQYEKVGAGGELKHGTLGEVSYSNKADTYGRMMAITREQIINDDLGALTSVPSKLGRGAALTLNEVFWTAWLADNNTFYTSGRGNYISGGTTVLSTTSLKTALEKFRKQTDPDGKPLGVTPQYLVVPPELEITADELMTSLVVNTGGSATTEKVPNRNVWANKFNVVQASYLSNTAMTGYSTTAWWLAADPNDLPVIEIAFLNGRDMPIVESADADFDSLGIQFRGYFDFGVAKQEYRAAIKSAGA
jgi:phage major head subunit gpT-like protein/phage head maturation protease